ncbi:hypothetical protein [Actinokineospora sp. NPDC004072]
MTRPTDELVQRAKVLIRAAAEADDGRHRPLVGRLGAFFPAAPDFAWLDADDRTLELVFTSADGGWLDPAEDSEFWQVISTDADPQALVTLLEHLVDGWEHAAAAATHAEPGTDHPEPPRTHAEPESDPEPLAHTGPETEHRDPAHPPRYVEVEPVPGDDHPGWWHGYDTVDAVWKYVHTGAQRPTDSAGWTPDMAPKRVQQPLDLDTALDEAIAAAIADVRALGISPEEMSNEEIIDALQRAVAAELPTD